MGTCECDRTPLIDSPELIKEKRRYWLLTVFNKKDVGNRETLTYRRTLSNPDSDLNFPRALDLKAIGRLRNIMV